MDDQILNMIEVTYSAIEREEERYSFAMKQDDYTTANAASLDISRLKTELQQLQDLLLTTLPSRYRR